jgi:putative membrane protein
VTSLALVLAAFGDRFGHHGHRPLRLLLFVLFVLLVVAVVWLVVREVRHRRVEPAAAAPGVLGTPPATDTALEQLRLRYARSEIDRDDYMQRLRDLGGTPPP